MHPSSAPPIPSAIKVFSVHELVRLIASFNTVIDRVTPTKAFAIGRKDLVHFSQVCQQTFETLAPAIWESVSGAENLLRLIESASFVYDDTSGKLRDMTLPSQPTERTFERFDFYAPYVKHLDVYGKSYSAFDVQGWSTLTTRSHSHPLLPHLKSILFRRNPSSGFEHDEFRWISCFATTTTVEVITTFNKWLPGLFPYAAASKLLKILINRCPNVETLTLHPWDANEWHIPDSSKAIFDNAPLNPWYQHLQSLPNLQYLSVSEGWLSPPSLHALSRIPKLKSLEIHPGDCKGFDIIDDLYPSLELSPGAFPTLDMLSLRENCPLTTAKILGIRGMVLRLTSLYIELGPEWDEDEDLGEGSGSGADLILLLQHMPNLKHLAINFHSRVANIVYPIKFPEALDVMVKLPLQTLKLPNLHLGSGALGVNFGMVWSNVTKLTMPHQYASLEELWYFATMPKLKRLTLMLDLTSTYTPANISSLPRTPLRALEGSLGSRINFDWEVIRHNAETIAQFWPGTRFVRQVRQPGDENEIECWDGLVSLIGYLINIYSTLHAADTQEAEEEARMVLEEDEAAWKRQIEGISDPQDEYVYGGPGLSFDYKE